MPDDVLGHTENSNRSNGIEQNLNYVKSIHAENKVLSDFLTTIVKKINPLYEFVILQDELTLLMMKAEMAGRLYTDARLVTLNEARTIIQYEEMPDGDKFFDGDKEKKKEEIKKLSEGKK